jgi:hypothetical protein
LEVAQPADVDRSLVSHAGSRSVGQVKPSVRAMKAQDSVVAGAERTARILSGRDGFVFRSLDRSCVKSSDHVGRKCVSDVISSARFLGERE